MFKIKVRILAVCSLIFISVSTPSIGGDQTCPALPLPSGTTVTVSTVQDMWNAVNTAVAGTTILIADGTYNLGQNGYYLWIDTVNITLRSLSGNRESVILDDNYSQTEIITIAASNVTIADLTIKRAGTHPIHVVSTDSSDVSNTLIYNVHIIDPGQQAIKINPHAAKVNFTDNGVVACSTLELTDSGRAKVIEINGSCYTGGVDGHQSRGWVVRDNIIKGFWCGQGLSEHGVHFWTGSRGTTVERNSFIDNARGIGFGLRENGSGRTYPDDPCAGATGYVAHYDGIIRNNVIFASSSSLFASEYGADGGIALAQACGAQVLHNTIAFTQAPFAAIEWRFANTSAGIINNLTTHNLMNRGGFADLSGNLSEQPLLLFVDGENGDLHLAESAAAAIDQGTPVLDGTCGDDYDGYSRPAGAGVDIGADEYHNETAAGNTAPTAEDQSITVTVNSTENPIGLTGSDSDGDGLSFTVTNNPSNGFINGTAPNLYYTPNSDYAGVDSLTFKVNDGTNDSAEATITITVQKAGLGDMDNSTADACFIDTVRVRDKYHSDSI